MNRGAAAAAMRIVRGDEQRRGRDADKTGARYPTCYWLGRVIAHHYCLSFGMYWAHRYLHVNKFLWRHIHSLHHFATIPLARAT